MNPNLPPNDLESEWAIIASILGQPWDSKIDQVIGNVAESDFFDAGCRVVFRAIEALNAAKLAVDQPSVKSWLTRNGLSGQVDWNDFKDGLANSVWVGDVGSHIEQVRRMAKLRRLIETCHRLAAEGYQAADRADEYVATAEAEIYKCVVESTSSNKVIHTMKDALTSLYARVQDEMAAELSGKAKRVTTGLLELDNILGPLRPGLCIVAARPSIGKTALMLNIAAHNAAQGIASHVISLETDKETIAGRALANNSETSISTIMSGRFGQDELSRTVSAIGRLSKTPITIDDRSGLNLAQIRSSIRRAAAELRQVDSSGKVTQKLGLVCLDYLQLAHADVGKNDTREREVSKVAQGLLEMAKEFNVVIIALAQLNRESERTKGRKPTMADIRESGGIEAAADVVIALHRENEENRGAEVEDIEAIVLKFKNGRVGTAGLKFRGAWMRFMNSVEVPEGIDE